jgi:hypothetical protein
MDKSYSARLENTTLEKFRAHLDSFPMSFFGKGAYGRCKDAPPPENMFSYNTVLTVKNEPFRLHYIYTDRNRGDTVARITAAIFRNDELHINIAWDAESSETYIGNLIFSIKHFWKDALIDPSGSTEANTQQRAAPQTDRPESNITNHVFTTPVSPERFVAWITGKCNAYPFSFGWIDDSTDTDTAMCFSRLAPDCKRRGPDYILTWFVGATRGDMYRGERESIIFRVCELLTEPVTSKIVAECVFDPALNYFERLLRECGQSLPETETTEPTTAPRVQEVSAERNQGQALPEPDEIISTLRGQRGDPVWQKDLLDWYYAYTRKRRFTLNQLAALASYSLSQIKRFKEGYDSEYMTPNEPK